GREPAGVLPERQRQPHPRQHAQPHHAEVAGQATSRGKQQTPSGNRLPEGVFTGAPGRIRTSDLRIRSPLLYPLSYGRILSLHRALYHARVRTSTEDLPLDSVKPTGVGSTSRPSPVRPSSPVPRDGSRCGAAVKGRLRPSPLDGVPPHRLLDA